MSKLKGENTVKKKIDYERIEEAIDQIDSLYYWAADYCKANNCDVKKFIRENYGELMEQIKLSKRDLAFEDRSKKLAKTCAKLNKAMSPKSSNFTVMASAGCLEAFDNPAKSLEERKAELKRDGDFVLVPDSLLTPGCMYKAKVLNDKIYLEKIALSQASASAQASHGAKSSFSRCNYLYVKVSSFSPGRKWKAVRRSDGTVVLS